MKNNYKYFQNNECEYFPCHKINNDENFNCLFCYCPLYFLEECGGNKKLINGIKDCSDCLIPHSKIGYDYIVGKIMESNSKKTFCRE
jgi:Zn-finger protein